MTKDIKIFYTPFGEETPILTYSAPVTLDLSAIRQYYEKLGEKHLKNFIKFSEYWENEGFDKLFFPRAVVKSMSIELFKEKFGSETITFKENSSEVMLMVWTIGADLEKQASNFMDKRGTMMEGLMLDVTGSISLYTMHNALTAWLKEFLIKDSKYLAAEYYPGVGTMRQDLMEHVVEVGRTTSTIGVCSAGTSFMRPRKSECSFIALSKEPCDVVIHAQRCEPCTGKRCLYFQLGGCHMMTQEYFEK